MLSLSQHLVSFLFDIKVRSTLLGPATISKVLTCKSINDVHVLLQCKPIFELL